MMAYWAQLKLRERWLLIGAGGVILVVMMYLMLWEPVVLKIERLQSSVKSKQELVAWMQQSAVEYKQLKASSSSTKSRNGRGGQSLLAIIDRSAQQQRLSLRRVEPDGANRVRVSLESVSFDNAMRWIENVQRQNGVQVVSAVLDRDKSPGRVNVRLVFEGSS